MKSTKSSLLFLISFLIPFIGKSLSLENPVKTPTSVLKVATTVTGMIIDASGTPIIGVNILEKGTGNGTITEVDGSYSITTLDDKAILVYSFVGYNCRWSESIILKYENVD